MIGTCNINGIIGEVLDAKGNIITPNVTFLDVVAQVERQKGITELQVFIQSHGGSVEESDAMYEYFQALKAKGITVTTIAQKFCMSAAVKLLLAGSPNQKVIEEGTSFMIHNPWLSLVDGDADRIEAYGRELRKLETASIDFYANGTNTSREALKTLMKKDTYLSVDQVIDFGFADRKAELVQLKAVAFSNKFNYNKNTNEMNETLTKVEAVTLFDKMLSKIKQVINPVQLKMELDATGEVEIVFNDLEVTATPTDGDVAMINGKLATGEHTMPNGDVYKFNDKGELKIEVAKEEVEDDITVEVVDKEKEDLKAEVEALKAEIAELKDEKATMEETAAKTVQANQVVLSNLQKDMLQLKNSISSDFTIDVANDNSSKGAKGNASRQLFKK